MCNPVVAAIALGANAIGNYIQQRDNNRSLSSQINARNARAAQGVQEQQPNIAEGQSALDQAIQKLSGPAQEASQNAIAANRTAAINANTSAPSGSTNPMTDISNAPTVVQSDLAKKMSDAASFANQQAGALGAMGATGDQFAANSNMLGLNATDLSNLSHKAQQEANVNRIQQQSDYENARRSPSIFGQLLSTIGNATSMYAAGRPAQPAANTNAAPPVDNNTYASAPVTPVTSRDLPPITG